MTDVLLYISDQHAYQVQGYAGDPLVRTPNLDRIARDGVTFDRAYTAYPVCVPARMSMLTGTHSSRNGVMTNNCALNSNLATFVHCLDVSGYETVLCGRMHFVGPDQRHGFARRIAGDITQVYHNRPARVATERGVHDKTPQGGPSSLGFIGGGNSPTLEYDRYHDSFFHGMAPFIIQQLPREGTKKARLIGEAGRSWSIHKLAAMAQSIIVI